MCTSPGTAEAAAAATTHRYKSMSLILLLPINHAHKLNFRPDCETAKKRGSSGIKLLRLMISGAMGRIWKLCAFNTSQFNCLFVPTESAKQ